MFFKGSYAGFNTDNPTSDSGGKTKVVQDLKERHDIKRYLLAFCSLHQAFVTSSVSQKVFSSPWEELCNQGPRCAVLSHTCVFALSDSTASSFVFLDW